MPQEHPSPLRVAATLENLKVIRDYVEGVARSARFPDMTIYDLVLAVDEAATNIIVHGYKVSHGAPPAEGQAGVIEVKAEHEEPALRVTLRDQAPPFDPTAAAVDPKLPPLADRMPGGLGIFLMRKTMDEIYYSRTPDGWNALTLIVFRPTTSEEV